MKGMTTCKVCGRDFPLIKEDHYIARDSEKKGVLPVLSGQEEATWYDSFDCPHCGCQNVMQERKCPCDFGICDECDECDNPGDKEKRVEELGCYNCKYTYKKEWESPCKDCSHNHVSKWERKEEDDE